jgi:hypothetical protein
VDIQQTANREMMLQLQSKLLSKPQALAVLPESHRSPARSISPMLVAQYAI